MSESGPIIFVSYRGEDVPWAPDLVYRGLVAAFRDESVFKAGCDLRPGQEFPPILEERAARCPIMLVCIGPRWLTAQNADGTRRLDDALDWVRREIELSLANGNHVIPLMLGNRQGTPVPREHDLPMSIRRLVRNHAIWLEPGGNLELTMPALITRMTELAPGLAARVSPRAGSTITSRTEVKTLIGGSVTGVRAPEGVPHRIDATVEIGEVTKDGEVVGVDLRQRNHRIGA